jgi:hypothetical protein
MAFELMELSTGNLVGIYSTREAALRDVAEAIRRGGPSAVESLALGEDDPTGATEGALIAEGSELADLVLRGHGAAAS